MEILGTDKITQQPWVNLFLRRFCHNGKEGQWSFASRQPHPSAPAQGFEAVIIVPILLSPGAESRLVVTREYRIPLGDFEYGFPAGLVEQGESVAHAARREVLEETGLEVIDFQKISPPTYSSSGLTDEAVVIAFATVRSPEECRQRLEGSEIIEVLHLDYRQVCDLCDSPVRVNGRAWPIFHMYQRLGRLE